MASSSTPAPSKFMTLFAWVSDARDSDGAVAWRKALDHFSSLCGRKCVTGLASPCHEGEQHCLGQGCAYPRGGGGGVWRTHPPGNRFNRGEDPPPSQHSGPDSTPKAVPYPNTGPNRISNRQ